MSEDYKKIEFEDVKEGQRVRINLYHYTFMFASYTGTVVNTNTDLKILSLGCDREHFQVCLSQSEMPDIFLLEDASEPSRMSTALASGSVRVESDRGESFTFLTDMTSGGATYFEYNGILRFASVDQWNRHEERFRDKRLKDLEGDVWAYINGKWQYWCRGSDGYWSSDTPVEDYVEDGFTIVDSLD